MKIVIIGGGKLGFHLARSMQDKNHQVTLIERDKRRCQVLANDLDGEVVCGDGTELSVLSAPRSRAPTALSPSPAATRTIWSPANWPSGPSAVKR